MKGIEKITAHIESDARAEAAATIAAAEEKAREVQAEYAQKAQDEYWAAVRAGVRDCEDRVDRMGRLAAMESRKAVLSEKQELVSAAFGKARDMLINMPRADYTAFLSRLAAASAVTGGEEVMFNPRDKADCAEAVIKAANAALKEKGMKGELKIAEETREICAGLILRQGGVEINCAVDTLLELCRGEMSSQLAEVMFE